MFARLFYLFTLLIISPILLAQGLWARKRTLRLPEPEGKRIGQEGQGEPLRVLILGDSAGAGVGVDTQEKALSGQLVKHLSTHYQVDWQLIATTGHTTKDCLEHLEILKIQNQSFDYVLISLGVNDVTSRISSSDWIEQCQHLVDYLQTQFSPQCIVWSDLPPMEKFTALPQPLRWVIGNRKNALRQALISWMATQKNLELLAFPDIFNQPKETVADWIAADGYHPGEKVYEVWGKLAAEKIQQLKSQV